MHASTRFKKVAGIGLLALALTLTFLTGVVGQHRDGKGGVPAAYAGFGPPPDLTGGNSEPTPTPTPRP